MQRVDRQRRSTLFVSILSLLCSPALAAQGDTTANDADANSAAEMARALQDPLAAISALMTDNDVLFGTGKDEKPSVQF